MTQSHECKLWTLNLRSRSPQAIQGDSRKCSMDWTVDTTELVIRNGEMYYDSREYSV